MEGTEEPRCVGCEPHRLERRRFMRRAAVGAGVAWVAPVILSQPAQAQGSGAEETTLDFGNGSIAQLSCSGGTIEMAFITPSVGNDWAVTLTRDALGVCLVTIQSVVLGGPGSISSITPGLPATLAPSQGITVEGLGTPASFTLGYTCECV
jgi:hypothetical protein